MNVKDIVMQQYQDAPKEHQDAAVQSYVHGTEWLKTQPVSSSQKRLDRKEQRRLRRNQQSKMYDYIYEKMTYKQSQTIDGVQVVGIGFIALVILSAIISWAVQKLLNEYWGD